jgi:hypothetical protein
VLETVRRRFPDVHGITGHAVGLHAPIICAELIWRIVKRSALSPPRD